MNTLDSPVRRSTRFLLALIVLGLIGVASLALAPLEMALPEGIEVPRIALLVQPAILVALFAAAGWWAAPKAGLDAPFIGALTDGTARPAIAPALRGAVLAGALCASILLAYGWLTADVFAGQKQPLALPLLTRVLYGGITEEIMTRWGALSLMAALLVKVLPRPGAAAWAANGIAAVLFGAGHLPLLFSLVPDPPAWLVLAVMVGNFGPGLVFGWLFMRRGLEAAIIAHALAHVTALSLAPLLIGNP